MASITIDGVAKTFGAQKVLHDLSLHVPDGAFYTLLGPSGCGKTTLLRCIAGFYTPDSGRLLFDNDDVTQLPAYRRDMPCFPTRRHSTTWPMACARAAWAGRN